MRQRERGRPNEGDERVRPRQAGRDGERERERGKTRLTMRGV